LENSTPDLKKARDNRVKVLLLVDGRTRHKCKCHNRPNPQKNTHSKKNHLSFSLTFLPLDTGMMEEFPWEFFCSYVRFREQSLLQLQMQLDVW